jgi:D-proline reductase (dithiol) PrdB
VTRLTDLPPGRAKRFAELECPDFETRPWVRAVAAPGGDRLLGGPCRTRRKPISRPRSDYRAIPATIAANDLLCSHISISFDRTGFQEDWNVVFPLDRLNELAAGG